MPNLLLAARIDKLAIGTEYGVGLFTIKNTNPDWKSGLKINLEMRYGSIFTLIHNFTLGYAVINNSNDEDRVHTINYGYDFGIRLYAGDYVFFDGGIGLKAYSAVSGEYIIRDTWDLSIQKCKKFDFGAGFFLGMGFNIPITKKISFLLLGDISFNSAINSNMFRGDISTLLQFKI